jgi:hypothetical protein
MVTYTIDLFMGEGMIFNFYYNWLKKHKKNPITKPLGLCSDCMNIWITAGLIALFFIIPIASYTIIGFGISNRFLKKVYEL